MQGNMLQKIKMTLFFVFALALMVISFHGGLDEFARESVIKTTNQSILILAVTGAIDAAISLIQSFELEAGVVVASGSLQWGELLDPINDAVERLLSVMIWAVGSLALQRIILEVVSTSAFNWAFFGVGLIAIATWILGTSQQIRDVFGAWDGFTAFFVRMFIYLAVFRFIVPVFVIIGFFVGHLLFDAEINKSTEDLSQVNEGISIHDDTPLPGTPEFEEHRSLKVTELHELREGMASTTKEAGALDARIKELRAGGGLRRYLPERLGGPPSGERQALRESGIPELDDLLKRLEAFTEEDEALDTRIQELGAGGGLRRYLPERLGGPPSGERQALRESGIPELDDLLKRLEAFTEEAEALDTRIQELRAGGGLRQYLPESLGGPPADERQALEETGVPELDDLLKRLASFTEEAEALNARIHELRGGGLRRYLPESLGGPPADERQALEETGVPELDDLLKRLASFTEEDEALDARIHELRAGSGLRQFLPERLGGPPAGERQERRESGIPELDDLLKRLEAFTKEAKALDVRIHELRGGGGLRQFLPERLGGPPAAARQALGESGIPELDDLLERLAALTEEAEALDAQLREFGVVAGIRQYLLERLGIVSPEHQPVVEQTGLPELDNLLRRLASLTEKDEALDARIQELKDEAGLRQYLPESFGGVPAGEELEAAEKRREDIGVEIEAIRQRAVAVAEEHLAAKEERREEIQLEIAAIESRVRGMEEELLTAAEARREQIRIEMGTIESRVRGMEGEQLTAAEARREQVRIEMETIESRVRGMEEQQLTAAEARREQIGLEMATIESRIRAMEEQHLGAAEARRGQIHLEMEAIESRVRSMEEQQLAAAVARNEQIQLEMQTIQSRVRIMEEEQLASAVARREQIRFEVEAIEARIRVFEEDLLSTAQARREQIGIEVEDLEARIGVFEADLLSSAQTRRQEVRSEMEATEGQISAVQEELECIDKRSAGDDCVSLMANLSNMAKEGYARIRDLVGKAGDIVTTTIKLMIFIIVKNILLPIGFLMLAVKCALPIARYGAQLTTDFRRDVKELAATVSPGQGSAHLKGSSEST